MSRVRVPLRERFEAKYKIVQETGCWNWTASKHLGYGQIGVGGREGGTERAHRVSWEIHRGPIPEGLVIDHLCRNRGCVNPDHLRLTTIGENVMCGDTIAARKLAATACPNGHEYTAANIYRFNGHRLCRACRRAADARRAPRRRGDGGSACLAT